MTLGMQRSNPWNLMVRHVPWFGLVDFQPADGPLEFVHLLDGIRAGVKLCYSYEGKGWNTPALFVMEFSPASAGNPTGQYIANVCDWTGFTPTQLLDFHSIPVMKAWARSVWRQEQGADALSISDDTLEAGIALAESE